VIHTSLQFEVIKVMFIMYDTATYFTIEGWTEKITEPMIHIPEGSAVPISFVAIVVLQAR
jgi:hypothetical protein